MNSVILSLRTQTCISFASICILCTVNVLNTLPYVLVDIPDYCKAHPTELLPDPDNCAKFFNCSESLIKPRSSRSSVAIGKFGYECPYPELYDTMLQMCSNFTQVRCTTRWEPMAPCKYFEFLSCRYVGFLWEITAYCKILLPVIKRNLVAYYIPYCVTLLNFNLVSITKLNILFLYLFV